MTDPVMGSPEDTVARGDPGDETANRYRYQWIWAAIVCCMLLDDTQDAEEVFCEHHEDVLIKHKDGSFTGHQVKTRSEDQPLWRVNDQAVFTACVRFARLESEYPGRFRHFYFLTNHLLHSAGNGQDLPHVLRLITNAATVADLSSNITSWIRRVARNAEVTDEVAFVAMSKTRAKADLPKLRDAVMRLIDTIVQCWAPATECSHESVKRAAYALIDECSRASSLDQEQLLPAYMVTAADGDADVAGRIDGKRMTLRRVQSTLEQGRDCTATLAGDPDLYVEPGGGSIELLRKKLDAGGFSVVSRNSAEDLRNRAEYLGIGWIKKHGPDEGLKRYDHVCALVLNDAARALEVTPREADDFGPRMREGLRRRFRERRTDGSQLYDCTDDHLEGIAFSLTAQCKVVWSHGKSWEAT
jgi:hypothetical protein